MKIDSLHVYTRFAYNDYYIKNGHAVSTGIPGGNGEESYTAYAYITPDVDSWRKIGSPIFYYPDNTSDYNQVMSIQASTSSSFRTCNIWNVGAVNCTNWVNHTVTIGAVISSTGMIKVTNIPSGKLIATNIVFYSSVTNKQLQLNETALLEKLSGLKTKNFLSTKEKLKTYKQQKTQLEEQIKLT